MALVKYLVTYPDGYTVEITMDGDFDLRQPDERARFLQVARWEGLLDYHGPLPWSQPDPAKFLIRKKRRA